MLVMMILAAAATPAPALDPAARHALLDAARGPVTAAFGRPVLFRVRQLKVEGGWAFVLADMEAPGGRPIDYAGTALAEAAAQGMVSRAYAALLRREGDRWTVVDHAIGPADVAWEGWLARHGAPATIIQP